MKTLAIAAAAISLAVGATPVLAANPTTMTLSINTDDLDLDTQAGQKALDQRIERAARTVCRITSPTTGTRVMSHQARSCLAKARASAKTQVAAIMENKRRGG